MNLFFLVFVILGMPLRAYGHPVGEALSRQARFFLARNSTQDYPFMVSIRLQNKTVLCGAALIPPDNPSRFDMILTAASCVCENASKPLPLETIRKLRVVGGSSQSTFTYDETRVMVTSIANTGKNPPIECHPEYDTNTFYNDLAIVRVWPPFRAPWHRPIDFMKFPLNLGDKKCKIMGWGETFRLKNGIIYKGTGNPYQDAGTLLETNVKIIKCPQNITEPYVLCLAEGSWACEGDSGGPIICEIEAKTGNGRVVTGDLMVGVFSIRIRSQKQWREGVRCPSHLRRRQYGTAISIYHQWIELTVAKLASTKIVGKLDGNIPCGGMAGNLIPRRCPEYIVPEPAPASRRRDDPIPGGRQQKQVATQKKNG